MPEINNTPNQHPESTKEILEVIRKHYPELTGFVIFTHKAGIDYASPCFSEENTGFTVRGLVETLMRWSKMLDYMARDMTKKSIDKKQSN